MKTRGGNYDKSDSNDNQHTKLSSPAGSHQQEDAVSSTSPGREASVTAQQDDDSLGQADDGEQEEDEGKSVGATNEDGSEDNEADTDVLRGPALQSVAAARRSTPNWRAFEDRFLAVALLEHRPFMASRKDTKEAWEATANAVFEKCAATATDTHPPIRRSGPACKTRFLKLIEFQKVST